MKNNSPTEAGQANSSTKPSLEQVDAINQLFVAFKLAYHNQYMKTYGDASVLQKAQKLWLRSLLDIPAKRIIQAGQRVICEQEFLPTLHRFRKFCELTPEEYGLPTVRAAYMEACMKPSPKIKQSWSHPVVYHAGKSTGWHFLSNSSESMTFPIFERNYQILSKRAIDGEDITIDLPKAIEDKPSQVLPKKEQKQRLKQLRKTLGV